MPKRQRLSKAEKLNRDIARWEYKQDGAVVMLRKSAEMLLDLRRKRKRMLERETTKLSVPLSELHTTEVGKANRESWNEIPAVAKATPPAPVDDGIPDALWRTKRLAALPDPRGKEKKAERHAAAKEVRAAELAGKRRKLPPSGNDALRAIKESK